MMAPPQDAVEARRVACVAAHDAWWIADLPAAAKRSVIAPAAPPPSLSVLTRRLGHPTPGNWRSRTISQAAWDRATPADTVWPWGSGPDVPARFYTVDGHELLTIVVPERYASALDAVREQRGRAESDGPTSARALVDPLRAGRALPEDVVRALDALPAASVIRTVVLSDDPHPLDIWFPCVHGEQVVTSLDIGSLGEVTLHRRGHADSLGADMRYAWAHLVAAALDSWSRAIASAWGLAEDLEEHPASNAAESLAVYLTAALDPDPTRFDTLLASSPIRTLVLARVLRLNLVHSTWREAAGQALTASSGSSAMRMRGRSIR